MKNPKHRDLMAELYRLWEKYETMPKVIYTEDSVAYWTKICEDVSAIYNKYCEDPVAKELLIGFYNGMGEEWKIVNPNPTIDKPADPEQVRMF